MLLFAGVFHRFSVLISRCKNLDLNLYFRGNLGKHSNEVRTVRLVPLKLYISAQNGRQNLLAFHEKANRLNSYRLDYMSNIRIEDEICEKFDALRGALSKAEAHMWGVNCKWNIKHTEHVEFEIKIEDDEQFIVRRLEREKRCGRE